jgi:hypothetical protein
MFVQVIQGSVSDTAELRSALDRWADELAPGAEGWLGSTAGVTDDGRFIALARFETAEAARTNSERTEQDQWWTQTSKLFTGEVTFHDGSEVDVDLPGNPDDAGFVQVMQGRTSDPTRARELMSQGDPAEWASFRPDVTGTVSVGHGDDAYTMAIYFTSEADAREGEKQEPPESIKELMGQMDALSVGEPEFFDLRDPWLYSPR